MKRAIAGILATVAALLLSGSVLAGAIPKEAIVIHNSSPDDGQRHTFYDGESACQHRYKTVMLTTTHPMCQSIAYSRAEESWAWGKRDVICYYMCDRGPYNGGFIEGPFVVDGFGKYCEPGYQYDTNTKLCEPTAPIIDKAKGKQDCNRCAGNPIELSTGNKFQLEPDFSDASGRLSFTRAYNSAGAIEGNRLLAGQSPYPATVTAGGSVYAEDRHTGGGGGIAISLPRDLGVIDAVWTHSYSRYVNVEPFLQGFLVSVLRPDGRHIQFKVSKTDTVTQDGDINERLSLVRDGAGTVVAWHLRTADNTVERYGQDGLLQSVWFADGYRQAMTFNASKQLTSVTDLYGRTITLAYSGNRLSQVKDSAGNVYGLSFNADGILSSVQTPQGTTRTYLYDEPGLSPAVSMTGLLTGIQDENAQRFASFYFDHEARGYQTEHAGGAERVTLKPTRSQNGGHLTSLEAVDALGATRKVLFATIQGADLPMATITPAGSGSDVATTLLAYDQNGNVTVRDAFTQVNGVGARYQNGVTRYYQYDTTRNLETHRKDSFDTSTQWHPFWRLKTRVAEPKRITTWVYNGQPDPSNGNAILRCAPAEAKVVGEPIAVICKRIEQATTDETGAQGFAATASGKPRVWAYTYNAFGQVLREDGPRTDIADTTTYTYYTDTVFNAAGEGHTIGDLSKITNAAGHITKYTLYDRAGRLLTRLEANGAETRYAYTPRGWLKAEVLRYQGQERFTSYTYDKVGQLTQVIAPNDYVMDFSYDAAHRLTGLRDSLGNRIQYTLDGAGNRLQEDVKDANGVLVQRTNRVFDQLGRLQNVKVQAP